MAAAVRPSPGFRIPMWIRAVAVLLVAGAILFAFARSTLEVYRVRREAADLERHLQVLRERTVQMREDLRRLQDPVVIERIAREELGLVKPGEVAIFLVPAEPPAPPRPQAPPRLPESLADRLLRWWRGVTGGR